MGFGDGGARGTVGVPVQVTVPVATKIQVECSTSSSILQVFLQYELDYIGTARIILG